MIQQYAHFVAFSNDLQTQFWNLNDPVPTRPIRDLTPHPHAPKQTTALKWEQALDLLQTTEKRSLKRSISQIHLPGTSLPAWRWPLLLCRGLGIIISLYVTWLTDCWFTAKKRDQAKPLPFSVSLFSLTSPSCFSSSRFSARAQFASNLISDVWAGLWWSR